MRKTPAAALRAVAVIAVALLAACSKEAADPHASVPPPAAAAAAKLAAADAADGQADKVVAKCAVCRLGMDGDAEHASAHAGYELHFCSADCKQTFDRDPAKVIARLPDTV